MDSLSHLVEALSCLPGVGPKSAQRMVFHLLKHQRQRGMHLASCLMDAMTTIINCKTCNNYTTNEQCSICTNPNRDKSKLCIVESPTDVLAIEQTLAFDGNYYVLQGKISPIDGIGPNEIGLDKLLEYIKTSTVEEVIIALTLTTEGITTIHYLQTMLEKHPIKISQLARGIPSGSELNFLDSNTISNSFKNREILLEP